MLRQLDGIFSFDTDFGEELLIDTNTEPSTLKSKPLPKTKIDLMNDNVLNEPVRREAQKCLSPIRTVILNINKQYQ